uniref:Disco-interacting protein 2 n=1 Tax=Cacopsylla melanoneura TaxID=428564 RepID=A0A8D8YIU8_9HEMI
MADFNVDIGKLPEEIREKLAELDLELSEGDITQKGFEKKRTRLLAPYAPKQPTQEVRQEAVQQALALNRPKPSLPMPSKRTSVLDREPHDSAESSTDEEAEARLDLERQLVKANGAALSWKSKRGC